MKSKSEGSKNKTTKKSDSERNEVLPRAGQTGKSKSTSSSEA